MPADASCLFIALYILCENRSQQFFSRLIVAETHRWFYLRVRALDLFASLMILECKLYNSTTCLPHRDRGTTLSALHKERT